MTSSDPGTGKAATATPAASASIIARPKVSVRLGKLEHIGSAEQQREFHAAAVAEEHGIQIARGEGGALRSVPDQHLRTGPAETKEGFKVLLGCQTPDAGHDRARQVGQIVVGPLPGHSARRRI